MTSIMDRPLALYVIAVLSINEQTKVSKTCDRDTFGPYNTAMFNGFCRHYCLYIKSTDQSMQWFYVRWLELELPVPVLLVVPRLWFGQVHFAC